MTGPLADLLATAYHEAGHAVAAVLTRRALASVDIEPTAARSGFCRFTEVPWPRRPSKRRCEDAILRSLAGPAAEELWLGLEPSPYGMSLRMAGPGFIDNVESSIIEGSHREHDLDRGALWRRAVEMVRTNWSAVEALADALLSAGQPISGKEARHVIAEALKRAGAAKAAA